MKSYLTLIFFVIAILIPARAASITSQSSVAGPAPTATAPVWGRLVVTGNTVTCYYALGTAKPTVWKQLGVPKTIGFLNNPLLVGLFITAHNSSVMANGTVDNFSITPAPKYRLQDVDIGAPSLMGSANLICGVWRLSGSGADVWGASDACNFQPWLVWGDCTVVCRVTSISSGDAWQKIGIMVRDGYNSGADNAVFFATNGSGNCFQYRPEFNVNPDGATVATLVAPATTVAGTAIGVSPIGSSTTVFTLRP